MDDGWTDGRTDGWMNAWMYTKIGNQDRKYSRYQTRTPVLPAGWEQQAGYYKNRYQRWSQEQMVRQRYAQTGSSCRRAWAWTCGHEHSARFQSSNDGALISCDGVTVSPKLHCVLSPSLCPPFPCSCFGDILHILPSFFFFFFSPSQQRPTSVCGVSV